MIFSPSYVQIGFIEKTHGTDGWMKIKIFENSIPDLSGMEFLFLEQLGQKVPFKIENSKANLLKFKGFNTIEESSHFEKCGVFRIKEDQEDISEVNGIVNFKIIDQNGNILGVIKEIEPIPSNPQIILEAKGKEIYLPFSEDLIIEIDEKNKVLNYNLPDGLLDL